MIEYWFNGKLIKQTNQEEASHILMWARKEKMWTCDGRLWGYISIASDDFMKNARIGIPQGSGRGGL